MVKKLLKHEFLAFFRSMFPIAVITLGMGLLTRIIQLFESDTTAYSIIYGSAMFMFGASIVVCLVASVALSVRRFYKNLFTAEGYLSMTLPVTAGQHVFAKLLVAVVGFAATFVTVLIALSIANFGEVLWEIFKAIGYILDKRVTTYGAHYIFYILEFILMAVVILAYNFTVFYSCISVGQMAKKNRVLAAFGAYFGYYVITQIIGTVFLLVAISMPDWIQELIESFVKWGAHHQFAVIHVILLGVSVFYGALSLGFFFLSRHLIKNRLNLE